MNSAFILCFSLGCVGSLTSVTYSILISNLTAQESRVLNVPCVHKSSKSVRDLFPISKDVSTIH